MAQQCFFFKKETEGLILASQEQVLRTNSVKHSIVMVMVMNLYSAFSINIFKKCALQVSDLWAAAGSRYQSISDLTQHMNE